MKITVRQLKRLIREAIEDKTDYTRIYESMTNTRYIDEFMNYDGVAGLETIFEPASMVCRSGQYSSALKHINKIAKIRTTDATALQMIARDLKTLKQILPSMSSANHFTHYLYSALGDVIESEEASNTISQNLEGFVLLCKAILEVVDYLDNSEYR